MINIDLTTTYLGLTLRTPLVAAASPLSENLDGIKRLEAAGAGAIVLYSLFEEQIRQAEALAAQVIAENGDEYEYLPYYPLPTRFHANPDEYLEHIRKAKEAVRIPIIASINGTTIGGWTGYARQMQEAGADAIELNLYAIHTDPDISSAEIEESYLEVVKSVKAAVSIPVAVKLSSFFTNIANIAKRLDQSGADGLVLFNRFYQPDLNLETLEVRSNILLSTPPALRLPLRWIAILYGRVEADLAATSGIHTAEDTVKMLLVGAKVTQIASALLKNGIEYLETIKHGLRWWMEENEFTSVQQMIGAASQQNIEDPGAFERSQYMRVLTSYRQPTWRGRR
jgi:dihydroorotate dehydrogenase (fumarate)